MNENIDLLKILKDCPKGWKFYSDVYGDVTFWEFSDLAYPIEINTKNHGVKLISEKGEEIMKEGKCILFPSEDQRDWSKFSAPWYKKEELIKPKFKVGDIIRHKGADKDDDVYEISKVYNDSYGLFGSTRPLHMKYQDVYELVPNKFDPRTLNPFDKILVRDSRIGTWFAAQFSHISYDLSEYDLDDCEEKLDFIICTTGSADFSYCVPFNDDTKSLVGTTKEAPKNYRYWED